MTLIDNFDECWLVILSVALGLGLISQQTADMHFWPEYCRSDVFFSGYQMKGHTMFYDTVFMLILITLLRQY